MPLTLPDVLALLAVLPSDRYRWGLDDLGMLRCHALVTEEEHQVLQEFSPLTALAYELTGILYDPWLQWDAAAAAIDIPLTLASQLVSAEDADMKHAEPIRHALLQVLGIALSCNL